MVQCWRKVGGIGWRSDGGGGGGRGEGVEDQLEVSE